MPSRGADAERRDETSRPSNLQGAPPAGGPFSDLLLERQCPPTPSGIMGGRATSGSATESQPSRGRHVFLQVVPAGKRLAEDVGPTLLPDTQHVVELGHRALLCPEHQQR